MNGHIGNSAKKEFEPVPSKKAIAPEALLKIICCNCRVNSDSSRAACSSGMCSCRSYGFKKLGYTANLRLTNFDRYK